MCVCACARYSECVCVHEYVCMLTVLNSAFQNATMITSCTYFQPLHHTTDSLAKETQDILAAAGKKKGKGKGKNLITPVFLLAQYMQHQQS